MLPLQGLWFPPLVKEVPHASKCSEKKKKNILLLPRGEGRKGKYWGKVLVNTTVRYKISHKDILYNMGNIATIL